MKYLLKYGRDSSGIDGGVRGDNDGSDGNICSGSEASEGGGMNNGKSMEKTVMWVISSMQHAWLQVLGLLRYQQRW